jgi:hypothetical protein
VYIRIALRGFCSWSYDYILVQVAPPYALNMPRSVIPIHTLVPNLNLAFNVYFCSRHAISRDEDESFGARSVEWPALENESSKFSSDDEMHEHSDDSEPEEDCDRAAQAGHNSAWRTNGPTTSLTRLLIRSFIWLQTAKDRKHGLRSGEKVEKN